MASNNWADNLENEAQEILDRLGITDNSVANRFSVTLLQVISWYMTGLDMPVVGKIGDKAARLLNQQDLFDMDGAYREGNAQGLASIRNRANLATTVAGGIWGLFSWAGLIIDVIGLVDGMIRASLLIGGVYAKRYGFTAEAIEKEDFLCIIAYWVGEKGALDSPESKIAFYELILGDEAAQKIAFKLNIKTSIKGGIKAGFKPAAKASLKAAEKVISKFTIKAASKTGGKGIATMPGLAQIGGFALSASINRWFMGQLLDAAEEYYDDKFSMLSIVKSA